MKYPGSTSVLHVVLVISSSLMMSIDSPIQSRSNVKTHTSAESPSDVDATVEDDHVTIDARTDLPSDDKPTDPQVFQDQPYSAADCRTPHLVTASVANWCQTGERLTTDLPDCAVGQAFLTPMKRRVWNPEAKAWGPWMPHLNPRCQDEPPTHEDLDDEVDRAIKTMKIPPAPVLVAPISDWFLVNMDLVAYTDDSRKTATVTLLGISVEIELTPTLFTWDFGDGSDLWETTKPGGRYPDKTIVHRYTAKDTVVISLETTWSGRYRVVGDTQWRAVTGTGLTTSTSEPIELFEVRPKLVENPL